MAALIALQSTTASTVNITTQQTVGTYANGSSIQLLRPQVVLSSLNGAATTITVKIRNTTDGRTVYRYSDAKDNAADTGATFIFPSFYAAANKSYAIQVTSTNASDTSVTWVVDWYDATHVDAVAISGDGTAADNLELMFDGTGYNANTSIIGSVSNVLDKTGYSLSAAQAFNLTGDITGNLSGSVGSVTGAVGSVTGSVGSISGVTFPTNFAMLGINGSGHISRVTLVDTTTDNTDMRGTDNAALAATALTNATWTDAKAAFVDASITSRLAPTTAGRTLDVALTGEAGVDLDNIKQATGATTLSNITVPVVTTLTNLPSIPAGWITAAGIATGAIDADALATDAVNEIAAAVDTSVAAPSVADIAEALAGADLHIYAPATGSTLDLYRGDSYENGDGRAIPVTKQDGETHWPTTLSTVHLWIKPTAATLAIPAFASAASLTAVACTVTQATGASQAFRIDLTDTQLATLTASGNAWDHEFWLIANKDANPATLRSGLTTIRKDPTA